MTLSLKDVSLATLGSVAAGAIAWGAFGVSPMASLAVLGSAQVLVRVAQIAGRAWNQLAMSEKAESELYVIGGLFLGKYMIYAHKLPPLSWAGAFLLLVGAFLMKEIATQNIIGKASLKNASPSPAK